MSSLISTVRKGKSWVNFRPHPLGRWAFSLGSPALSAPHAHHQAAQPPQLSFGASYLLTQLLVQSGLNRCLAALTLPSPDTLPVALYYTMLHPQNFNGISAWYQHNYACLLYPQADVSSVGIYALSAALGTSANYQNFFQAYYAQLKPPLSTRTGLTALEGTIPSPQYHSKWRSGRAGRSGRYRLHPAQLRVLYLTDDNGTPLGLIPLAPKATRPQDATDAPLLTACAQWDIPPHYVLLKNPVSATELKTLVARGSTVLMHYECTSALYQELIALHRPKLDAPQYQVKFADTTFTVIAATVSDEEGTLYPAYLVRDQARRAQDERKFKRKYEHSAQLTQTQYKQLVTASGAKLLVASTELEPPTLVALSAQTKQLRDLRLRPLLQRSHENWDEYWNEDWAEDWNEELPQYDPLALARGQVLLNFMAQVLHHEMARVLGPSKRKHEDCLALLSTHQLRVYSGYGTTTAASPTMRELYRQFGLSCKRKIKLAGGAK